MPIERRNLTSLGRKRRRDFDRSLQKLRDLGMPDWALEYYRRASRIAGLPPHMVVCHLAVVAAGRQMQATRPLEAQIEEPLAEGEASGGASTDTMMRVMPSYESMQTLQRRVTELWHEIQRHGTLREPGEEGDAADENAVDANLKAQRSAPGTVTPLPVRGPAPRATGTRSRRR